MEKIMKEFEKQVNVQEGPWEQQTFPSGSETTKGIISRKTVTLYEQNGYLCENTVTREYRSDDYFDTSSTKRIAKING
tara:strand:+ start:1253 stop:1486 length:234 start_codon:yes stop_codon:yes gene_type:complete